MWGSARLRSWLGDERLRYVLAGGWNSLFGWAVFALLWHGLGERLGLWTLGVLAHAIATTQSFLVQRRLVFRSTSDGVAAQFIKFQLSYLVLLGVGALALNGLAAQGVHPLLAQFLAIALLAACGYVFGKSFTFTPTTLSPRALARRVASSVQSHGLAIAAFAVALLAFEAIWNGLLRSRAGLVGNGFALTGVLLLEGKSWILRNGVLPGLFNPPWFASDWCAGTALHADLRSLLYSPLQMLALAVDPLRAVHLNALLFAAIAFWGSYGLARKILGWRSVAAVVFATLGAANAFAPLGAVAGQAGPQHLYLWPLLVLALCWPRAAPRRAWALPWPAIGAALCMTGWLHFGSADVLAPAASGAVLLSIALGMLGRARLADIANRAVTGTAMALLLNGVRLYEGLLLPRDAMPASLLPSGGAWGADFGVGALLLACCCTTVLLWSRRRAATRVQVASSTLPWRHSTPALLLVLGLLLLLWFRSDALPTAWLIAFLPLSQLLLAWPAAAALARLPGHWAAPAALAASALVWVGVAGMPLEERAAPSRSYDPTPLLLAFEIAHKQSPPADGAMQFLCDHGPRHSERLKRSPGPTTMASPPIDLLLSWTSQASFWMLLVLLALRAWQGLLALARDDACGKREGHSA